MARTAVLVGLSFAAVSLMLCGCSSSLGITGCTPKIPETHPTTETLAAEQHALDLINGERASAGLSPLVMDEDLRAVARAHSEDMVARGFISHVNPDGLNPFDRIKAAGIGYVSAGENIAVTTGPTPAESARDGWMASPPHRANILRPQFNRTGMGVAVDGTGKYYFTQDFIGTTAKSGGGAVFDFGEPVVGN